MHHRFCEPYATVVDQWEGDLLCDSQEMAGVSVSVGLQMW